MKSKITHVKAVRWIALTAVLLNIFINYYSTIVTINGQTIGDVSNKYPTLFTPAGYAFSIWGLIYLSFIGYVIYQLLPSQRSNAVYDRLAIPLTITSILSIAWVFSFTYEQLALSVSIITAMLITAVLLFGIAKKAFFHQEVKFWVTVPFALYAGWLSVAIIANASTWLKDAGWLGGAWGEAPWTIIMIGIAFIIGLYISWRFRDLVFPGVVAWASVAIYVARQNENAVVALFALLAAIILLVWMIGFGVWLARTRQMQTAV